MTFLTPVQGGIRLRIHAVPNAAKSEVVGLHQDRLKIKIKSPATEGKANDALEEFLAELFGVGKSWVKIIQGLAGRSKTVEILGMDEAKAREVLLKHIR